MSPYRTIPSNEEPYILLIRDKEQQIEVKINLSPENYRQFLETMTEDQ